MQFTWTNSGGRVWEEKKYFFLPNGTSENANRCELSWILLNSLFNFFTFSHIRRGCCWHNRKKQINKYTSWFDEEDDVCSVLEMIYGSYNAWSIMQFTACTFSFYFFTENNAYYYRYPESIMLTKQSRHNAKKRALKLEKRRKYFVDSV